MTDLTALNRAFAEYARTIAGPYRIGDVLYRLCDQMVDILPVDGAGVCLANPAGGLQFVSATDDMVAQIEEHQTEAGEGPCHEAFLRGTYVTCDDLTAEQRWGAYVPLALDMGLKAVAGIPMVVEQQRIGAVNLYTRTSGTWEEQTLEIARLLADMASGYILNARSLIASEQLANQLQHALDSRVVIEQAKGIIAEHHGVDTATAFERIRQHARATRAKLHDVASAIVDRDLRLRA
jgi:GAF domain-containing protein